MGIRAPLEDFVKTTLASVPGYWQKLLYFGELRKGGAAYDHWGMNRRYGAKASVSAMSAAHTDVFLKILRTPLRTLLDDLRASAEPQQRSHDEYLTQLRESKDEILPQDEGGGSRRHLDVTLRALGKLIRASGNQRAG